MSVGVPIPGANFTATLEPRNLGKHDRLLTSRSKLAFPGHNLSSVDSERDALTVLKLLSRRSPSREEPERCTRSRRLS